MKLRRCEKHEENSNKYNALICYRRRQMGLQTAGSWQMFHTVDLRCCVCDKTHSLCVETPEEEFQDKAVASGSSQRKHLKGSSANITLQPEIHWRIPAESFCCMIHCRLPGYLSYQFKWIMNNEEHSVCPITASAKALQLLRERFGWKKKKNSWMDITQSSP